MSQQKTSAAELASSASTSVQQGILLMVLGTSIVPVMDAIAKQLGETLSPLLITWGRFFFQCLIMGIYLLMLRGPNALKPKLPWIHCARGLLLAFATLCFFWSLQELPLADAIAIFFIEPMVLTLLSAYFLKEAIGWHRRLAVIAGFIGALFIIRPTGDSFTPYAFLPVAAAFFFAGYMTLTRAYANIDHPATMQFASGLGAALVLTLTLAVFIAFPHHPFAPQLPTLSEWSGLFGIGVIAALGHVMVVMAVNRAPASVLAPFGYVEIIAATVLGWVFFNDWPDLFAWLGISIIISSGCYVFYRERVVSLRTADTHEPDIR